MNEIKPQQVIITNSFLVAEGKVNKTNMQGFGSIC
jgi:hypothetical protein